MTMNKDLHGNLECKTPVLLVNNGCGKQGRGVLGLLLLAVFAVFLCGKALAEDALVDGGVYLINCKNWNNYYLYPKSNYVQVANSLDKNRYWCATKVEKDGEVFYTFRNYDEEFLGVGTNTSSKGVYLRSGITLPATEKAIGHGNFNPNNSDAFLFKLVSVSNSYAVIPYEYRTTNNSWYLDANNKTVGLQEYPATDNNQYLWNFERVQAQFGLTDPSIVSGQNPITEGNTTYEFTRGTSQCFHYLGSYFYSILADNGTTNYTTYELSYEGLPSGTTCSVSSDNTKWTLSVGTLPNPAVTIVLKCKVTRFQAGNQIIQKEYSYPVVIGQPHSIDDLSDITDPNGCYFLDVDIDDASGHTTISNFTGFFDGQNHTIKNLNTPIFGTMTDAVVRNVNLENVNISNNTGNTGAIASTANGASRIYNVGVLSGSVGGTGNTGGLVGLLDGTSRVINCYSFADITSGGQNNTYVGGLVGNNSQVSKQTDIKTIVVNCMFYGDIDTDHCSNFAPVYGNKAIENDNSEGINPYCFFSEKKGTFAKVYNGTGYDINNYKRSWPAEEEYLTRFEYYRSILNSNRRLMAWWVSGNVADTALISKWVLDPSIAPYPILKKWGKYPSIINPDLVKVWDTATSAWVQRANAAPYRGKSLGTLSVKVKPGTHAASAVQSSYGTNGKSLNLPITDMDTLHHDYCYYKVQLPYYNEEFGSPSADPENHWDIRYGGNYTDSVVTGWKITNVETDETITDYNAFEANWEHGYNFADRHCIDKDRYTTSGRVFAQGGYYYVPEGVTGITIEAYWGKAVYLHNTGHYIDRVNITNYRASGTPRPGLPFEPAGTLPTTFQGQTVYQSWKSAVTAIPQATVPSDYSTIDKSVYDQAIVLLNNLQWRNENDPVGTGIDSKWHPYTIMSIDQDLDNEPDYCFELQFRQEWKRPGIQPIRFDFLPVPELGMAVRHNENQNTIGIMVPQGHFEITETSYMHTTQFEYDAAISGGDNVACGHKVPAPVILNGGHFEQIVVRYGPQNTTQYFIMGGHFRMLRFTPGAHTNTNQHAKVRLCAVNAIGGEYPEFYLSGIYRPDIEPNSIEEQGNPHCYTNGGKFDFIAGAGYDKILGSIYFKIDHSIIGEFYGGGINGSNPVGGSIDVTIDHSLVEKYCGGPKIGTMQVGNTTTYNTVTTRAIGTIFGRYYGGGNGGTSYYRETKEDGNITFTNPSTLAYWNNHGYKVFNPLNTINASGVSTQYEGPNTPKNRGYHALFEFECFVESNGLGQNPTIRSYLHWAQFGTTTTGDVTNTLINCTVKKDFYGGGNLANVNGSVTSILTDCIVLGNAFGGGFSGKIEPFRIHDKNHAHFPYIDKSGLMQDGLNRLNSLDYIDREYTWCYKNAAGEMFPKGVVIPEGANTGSNATFEYDGKWYILTTVSLEHLGAVSGNVTLTLTGETTVGTEGDDETGDVFGGGNESDVDGSTEVKLQGKAKVLGNVFGGGNIAPVGGNASVTIEDEPQNPNP